jgi:diadenosine tetraphosphate (Ap4A) HIT family hydrolase
VKDSSSAYTTTMPVRVVMPWITALINTTSPGATPATSGKEPHELAPEERVDFFTDLLHAGEALEQAYAADKINYQILGNLVPHLHAHIQPRFYGDAYLQPVSGAPEQPVFLTADEYLERIAAIRAALQLL